MPISGDDFDRGRTPDSWEDRITTFLNERPGQAFDATEIGDSLGLVPPANPDTGRESPSADQRIERAIYNLDRTSRIDSLRWYLDSLAEGGKIDARIIKTGSSSKRFYRAKP